MHTHGLSLKINEIYCHFFCYKNNEILYFDSMQYSDCLYCLAVYKGIEYSCLPCLSFLLCFRFHLRHLLMGWAFAITAKPAIRCGLLEIRIKHFLTWILPLDEAHPWKDPPKRNLNLVWLFHVCFHLHVSDLASEFIVISSCHAKWINVINNCLHITSLPIWIRYLFSEYRGSHCYQYNSTYIARCCDVKYNYGSNIYMILMKG